jgi:hypothetical protein
MTAIPTEDAIDMLPAGDAIAALRFVGDRFILANWLRDEMECMVRCFPCQQPDPDVLAAGWGLAVLLGGERPLLVRTIEGER